ncbi:hypothetical protein FUAX_35770 [Fulvitalea axinellae]|uniref:WbqC-like protein family protein n=1 Tax=Fulvitalea axinellae TaxID=1182444 RepID=A0AAU9DF63_9BACT|nr:hypothetical protein FUAX_35770 [Fulvitalea axinellae]
MSETILIEPQYLPPVEYFAVLLRAEKVIFDQHAFYEKQSYRNRCRILTANKVANLSIPICFGNRRKAPLSEMKIATNDPWAKNHWKSIQSAYGKAPFFEHYEDFFKPHFENPPESLLEFDMGLLNTCLRLLGISVDFELSDKYWEPPVSGLNDFRSKIHPKKNYENNNIITPKPYTQVFGHDFVKNLSVIDLLFCEGPAAHATIKSSLIKTEQKNHNDVH